MALNKVWSCAYEAGWSVSSECLKIPRKSQGKVMGSSPEIVLGKSHMEIDAVLRL
jgi:hypothetical protein